MLKKINNWQDLSLSPALFWDTDASKIKLDTHAKTIVERVIMHGTWSEFKSILGYYGKNRIGRKPNCRTKPPQESARPHRSRSGTGELWMRILFLILAPISFIVMPARASAHVAYVHRQVRFLAQSPG